MQDLKFKSKIKKLIDLKSKLEFIINNISRDKIAQKDHFLGEVIHEMTIILDGLEEFKTFHVFEIIQRLLEVFHNIENSLLNLTKNLYEVVLHLLNVGYQQIILLQSVLENKLIAQQSIQILEEEVGRNNNFFDFGRKKPELAALTFNNVQVVNNNYLLEYNQNKQLINLVSQSKNLAIDNEKFEEMMLSYKELIKSKNQISFKKNNEFVNLYHNINKFSSLYEELNLVPITQNMENLIFNIGTYLENKGIEVDIKRYWGKTRFPFFKMDVLENFLENLFEMIVDYIVIDGDGVNSLEIKTQNSETHLIINMQSRFFDISFEENAKKSNDVRLNLFYELLDKLDAKFQVKKADDVLSILNLTIPFNHIVYSAHQISFNGNNYFVLENNIISFGLFNNLHLKKVDENHFWENENKLIPIINFQEFNYSDTDKYIMLLKISNKEIAVIVEEINAKEQVVVEDDEVCYRGQNIQVLNYRSLHKLFNQVVVSKESA